MDGNSITVPPDEAKEEAAKIAKRRAALPPSVIQGIDLCKQFPGDEYFLTALAEMAFMEGKIAAIAQMAKVQRDG